MMNEEARKAHNEYMKEYRKRNAEKLRKQQRQHYHNNKDKYKEYQARYWQRKAQEAATH